MTVTGKGGEIAELLERDHAGVLANFGFGLIRLTYRELKTIRLDLMLDIFQTAVTSFGAGYGPTRVECTNN
jgi:hypothetical protein